MYSDLISNCSLVVVMPCGFQNDPMRWEWPFSLVNANLPSVQTLIALRSMLISGKSTLCKPTLSLLKRGQIRQIKTLLFKRAVELLIFIAFWQITEAVSKLTVRVCFMKQVRRNSFCNVALASFLEFYWLQTDPGRFISFSLVFLILKISLQTKRRFLLIVSLIIRIASSLF